MGEGREGKGSWGRGEKGREGEREGKKGKSTREEDIREKYQGGHIRRRLGVFVLPKAEEKKRGEREKKENKRNEKYPRKGEVGRE